MTRFSLIPENQSTEKTPTDYMLFSDRFVTFYSGHVLDNRCRVRPGPETPTVDFNELKDILLSTDLARNSELDWASG